MVKLLLKKELLELKYLYMRPGKKGKVRSKAAIAGWLVLFVLLYLVMAASFAGISVLFASAFLPAGLSWLYFSMLGLISLFLSSLVNMFIASSQLYSSKDKELLLPMPVKPSAIVLSRMFSLYLDGLLYESMTFLPAVVVFWIKAEKVGLPEALCPIAVFFLNSLVILSLSCIFGWIVKTVSLRLKNKAIVSVLVSLVLIGVYYVVYFRINTLLQSAVTHMDRLAEVISRNLPPFYMMGTGACGAVTNLAGWAGISVVLFAVVYAVISKSFIHIITNEVVAKGKAYTAERTRQASPLRAMIKKEVVHFVSSPAYMLNIGLGLLIMPALGIYILIKKDDVKGLVSLLPMLIPGSGECVPVALLAALCMIIAMCCFTAPSISLEGKSLWLMKSFPIDPHMVLRAKKITHMLLISLPVVMTCVLVSFALSLPAGTAVLLLLCALSFAYLSSATGILINLRHPCFTWTSETQPIKQGAAVTIVLFGGWGAAILMCALSWFTRKLFSAQVCLALILLLLILVAVTVDNRTRKKGPALFEEL